MKDNLLHIPSQEIFVGISFDNIDVILSKSSSGKIKREHIEACGPAHAVKIPEFYISKKLVTVADFEDFVESTSYITEAEKEGWGWIWEGGWKKKSGVSWKNPFGDKNDLRYFNGKDHYPVIQISWNDANEYVKWRSAVSGVKTDLPSEYQWEAFATAIAMKSMEEVASDLLAKVESSEDFICLLGEKLRNNTYQSGLFWEWTGDWYKAYSPGVYNRDFGEVYKVLRGGSFLSESIQRTREFRFRRCPTARSPYYSFRIVQYF